MAVVTFSPGTIISESLVYQPWYRFQDVEGYDFGALCPQYTTQTVEDGSTVTPPPVNQYGTSFAVWTYGTVGGKADVSTSFQNHGWSLTDRGTEPFDFSTPIEGDTTLYAIWVQDSDIDAWMQMTCECIIREDLAPNMAATDIHTPLFFRVGTLPVYGFASPQLIITNEVSGNLAPYEFAYWTAKWHKDPPPYNEEYPVYDWGIRVGAEPQTVYSVWRERTEREDIEPPNPVEIVLRSLSLNDNTYDNSRILARFDIIADEDLQHPIEKATVNVHQCTEWEHSGSNYYNGYTYVYDEQDFIIGYRPADEGEDGGDGGEEGDGGDEVMTAAVTDGTWSLDGDRWVFTQSNGKVARSKWLDIEHSDGHVYRYHFTSTGYMHTGWFVSGGLDYYAEETGTYAGTLWHERDALDGGMERWTDPPSLTDDSGSGDEEDLEAITTPYRTFIASVEMTYDDLCDGTFSLTYGTSGQDVQVQDGAILSFSVVAENSAGKSISWDYTTEAFAIPARPRLSIMRAWASTEPFNTATGSYTYTGDTMGEIVWWTGLEDSNRDGILDTGAYTGEWSVSNQSWYIGDFNGVITGHNVPDTFVGIQGLAITAEMSSSVRLYYNEAVWWAKPYNNAHAWQGRPSDIRWVANTDVTDGKDLGVLVFDAKTGLFQADITCLVSAANIQQKILTTTQSSLSVALREAVTSADSNRQIRTWPTDENGYRIPGIPAPPNDAEADTVTPGTDAETLIEILRPMKGLVLLVSYGIVIGGGMVTKRVINLTENTMDLTLSSPEVICEASYMPTMDCTNRPQAAILHYIVENLTDPLDGGANMLITNMGSTPDESTSRRDRTYEEMEYVTCLEAMRSIAEASTQSPLFIWFRYALGATSNEQSGLQAMVQLCYSEDLPNIEQVDIPACLISSFQYTEDFSIGKFANNVAMTGQLITNTVDDDGNPVQESEAITSGWQYAGEAFDDPPRPMWYYATSTDATIKTQETLNQKARVTAESMAQGTVDKTFAIPLNTDTAKYIILTGQLYRGIIVEIPDIQRFRLAAAMRPDIRGYIVSWTAAYTGAWTFTFELQSEQEIGAIGEMRVED